jgi:hypothetical protein
MHLGTHRLTWVDAFHLLLLLGPTATLQPGDVLVPSARLGLPGPEPGLQGSGSLSLP